MVKSWESEATSSHRVKALTNDEFQVILEKAESGDAEAAMIVAQRYLFQERYANREDRLVQLQNHMLVLSWLRTAAVLGRADAQASLYSFLQNSENEEDRKEAIRWLKKSAVQGFPLTKEELQIIQHDKH